MSASQQSTELSGQLSSHKILPLLTPFVRTGPTSGHLIDRTATDKPWTTFRKSSEKEKGGIREEVDAADYSGSVQGGGENRSQLKNSGYAAAAQ